MKTSKCQMLKIREKKLSGSACRLTRDCSSDAQKQGEPRHVTLHLCKV